MKEPDPEKLFRSVIINDGPLISSASASDKLCAEGGQKSAPWTALTVVPLPREGEVASDVFRMLNMFPASPQKFLSKTSRRPPLSSSLGFAETKTIATLPISESLDIEFMSPVQTENGWLLLARQPRRLVGRLHANQDVEQFVFSGKSCASLLLELVLRRTKAASRERDGLVGDPPQEQEERELSVGQAPTRRSPLCCVALTYH